MLGKCSVSRCGGVPGRVAAAALALTWRKGGGNLWRWKDLVVDHME